MDFISSPSWYKPSQSPSSEEFTVKGAEESLLQQDSCDDEIQSVQPRGFYSRMDYRTRILMVVLLLVNAALAIRLWRQSDVCSVEAGQSRFANLKHDTQVIYRNWSNHQSSDLKVQIDAWKSVDTMALEVMYSDSEALELGISVAGKRLPWDDSMGIYTVKAIHDLHCLKNIHRDFRNLEITGGPAAPEVVHHLYHCLNSLRQNIMCSADETPMALSPAPDVISDYQPQMCRNWNRLVDWARSPARNPCYRRATVPFKDDIIQFMWCEEGSPYREKQREYSREFGYLHREDIENQGWEFDETL